MTSLLQVARQLTLQWWPLIWGTVPSHAPGSILFSARPCWSPVLSPDPALRTSGPFKGTLCPQFLAYWVRPFQRLLPLLPARCCSPSLAHMAPSPKTKASMPSLVLQCAAQNLSQISRNHPRMKKLLLSASVRTRWAMLGLGTRLQTQERLPAPSSPRNSLLLRNQNHGLCPCWSSGGLWLAGRGGQQKGRDQTWQDH